jgi:hypothetical protein
MDSGWAVVIGAVIALVASIVTPWIKDGLERKHREHSESRAAVASALRLVANAGASYSTVMRGDGKHDEGVRRAAISALSVSVMELGLLLASKDAPIERMAREMIRAIQANSAGSLGVFTIAAAEWYRGELSADAALASYREKVKVDAAADVE